MSAVLLVRTLRALGMILGCCAIIWWRCRTIDQAVVNYLGAWIRDISVRRSSSNTKEQLVG